MQMEIRPLMRNRPQQLRISGEFAFFRILYERIDILRFRIGKHLRKVLFSSRRKFRENHLQLLIRRPVRLNQKEIVMTLLAAVHLIEIHQIRRKPRTGIHKKRCPPENRARMAFVGETLHHLEMIGDTPGAGTAAGSLVILPVDHDRIVRAGSAPPVVKRHFRFVRGIAGCIQEQHSVRPVNDVQHVVVGMTVFQIAPVHRNGRIPVPEDSDAPAGINLAVLRGVLVHNGRTGIPEGNRAAIGKHHFPVLVQGEPEFRTIQKSDLRKGLIAAFDWIILRGVPEFFQTGQRIADSARKHLLVSDRRFMHQAVGIPVG